MILEFKLCAWFIFLSLFYTLLTDADTIKNDNCEKTNHKIIINDISFLTNCINFITDMRNCYYCEQYAKVIIKNI